MGMHTLKVGIISKEDYVKRTIAIAKGEYRPKSDEPKVWFTSLKSMSEVLSSENQELLQIIHEMKPQSLTELEKVSGRRKSNLSRTLKTLESYGIVHVDRVDHKLIPKVMAMDFKVVFGVHLSKFLLPEKKESAIASGL